MSNDLSIEDALSALSNAFGSLRCVATPSDHGNVVHFSVHARNGDAPIMKRELTGSQFKNSRRLAGIIEMCRSELLSEGFDL